MECYTQFYKYAKRLALKWRHTRQMMMDKLIAKGASISLTVKVMTSLSNEGILNDAKVFELDIFMMEEKRYGYKRVKEYLLKKGYESSLIDTYVYNKEIEKDNCYYHFDKASRKYKNYNYSDDQREKLRNYLKRCGFNGKIINEVIKVGIIYENVM